MEVSGQLRAPAALLPGKCLGTHWIGDWVILRAGLDAVAKKKSLPAPSLVRIQVVQPVALSLY